MHTYNSNQTPAGAFKAADGPAEDTTSTDIGVTESKTTAIGLSLQLVGSGALYTDFEWISNAPQSFGQINAGMTFVGECDADGGGGEGCVADPPTDETENPTEDGKNSRFFQHPVQARAPAPVTWVFVVGTAKRGPTPVTKHSSRLLLRAPVVEPLPIHMPCTVYAYSHEQQILAILRLAGVDIVHFLVLVPPLVGVDVGVGVGVVEVLIR